ncbi:MAG: iron-containing alcohol dehydrogenase family protein [Clostridia bacterium]|nr:iron-containing alcohol dehydrogenase family protein [Clostridia bacterium]
MDNYTMRLPSYSIGDKVYEKIGEICGAFGKSAVIIGGKKALKAAEAEIRENAAKGGIEITDTLWYGGECSYENAEALAANDALKNADMIFAVGGGKALDTSKLTANLTGKKVFTFPTIASNCACCTTVSIMYKPEGVFIKPHFFEEPPVHAFINTKIMVEAPEKYIWAGMGDTVAKYYESNVSARGDDLENFTEFGVYASKMCCEPIVRMGAKAMEDNKKHVLSREFRETALAITASTAVVSIFLTRDHTPDYNSALAHAVFYGLTKYEQIEKRHLHGEVVAFGLLILLICDNQIDEFEKVYKFNKSVALPTSLEEIEITDEEMRAILSDVTKLSDVRHYPYEVTVEMLENAFEYLKNYNIIHNN